jgi:ketosteroid isomerase-like protein
MSQTIDPRFIDSFQAAFQEDDENVANKLQEAENVRRVEGVFRIIARKDFDALNDILAEDVSLEIIGSPTTPMAGLTQGRHQVIEATRNNFAQVEDQRPEIQSVVAQGDTVVVLGREQGRFRPTGRSYDLHWMHQYIFKNGKIVLMRELFDSAALLDVLQPQKEVKG